VGIGLVNEIEPVAVLVEDERPVLVGNPTMDIDTGQLLNARPST